MSRIIQIIKSLQVFQLSAFLFLGLTLSMPSNAESEELSDEAFKSAIIQSLKDKGLLSPVIDSRIVGGNQVSSNSEYRYFTLWMGLTPNGSIEAVCGGTLIARNKVLTAAHCTDAYATNRMAVVPNFYSFVDDLDQEDIHFINAKREHPSFTGDVGSGNDLAVLTLSTNSNTSTATLYSGTSTLVDTNATAIGIGRTTEGGVTANILREVVVPVVSNSSCSTAFPGIIRNSMICAGFMAGGRSTCQGDSGGPLSVIQNGVEVQVGITSFGRGCARPNIPGVYTRVNSFVSFIRQHAPNANFYNGLSTSSSGGATTNAPVVPAPATILLLED